MNWNGNDELTYAQVMELSRYEAARWWGEFCAPGDVGNLTREEVIDLARSLAPADEREAAEAAMIYAAECAGVLS